MLSVALVQFLEVNFTKALFIFLFQQLLLFGKFAFSLFVGSEICLQLRFFKQNRRDFIEVNNVLIDSITEVWLNVFSVDPEQIIVLLVDRLGSQFRQVRFIQQKPVGMLALKRFEIRVEEGLKLLESICGANQLLCVKGSVYHVIENIQLVLGCVDNLFGLAHVVLNDRLDYVFRTKGIPDQYLVLTKHQ